MKIGYVREIGFGIDIDIRRELLFLEGIFEVYIDSEKSRDEYRKMMSILSGSDELYIWSIEELGDEQEEILEQWRSITSDIGANITVISCPAIKSKRNVTLEEKMVSDMALKILSYNAETSIKELKKLEIFYDEE
nr:MAG TPA: DNA invertase [Caudoviricetes sp.]